MRFDSKGLVSTYLSQWMPTGDTTRQSIGGYFGGGYNAGVLSRIDKLSFQNDTKTTLSATLSVGTYYGQGFADSGVAGYSVSGIDSTNSYLTTSDKIAFPADTKTTTTAVIGRKYGGNFANSGVAGYAGNGVTNGYLNNTVQKMLFPSDTISLIDPATSIQRYDGCGFANNAVAGYLCGGRGAGVGLTAVIDKLTFPSDTQSVSSATLSAAREFLGASGMADYGVAGYISGGDTSGGTVTTIDKVAFPADTRSTLATGLPAALQYVGAVSDTGVAGYIGGGQGGNANRIQKYSFPSDVYSLVTATLTTDADHFAGCFSNQGVF
jgi:hypothetical protein